MACPRATNSVLSVRYDVNQVRAVCEANGGVQVVKQDVVVHDVESGCEVQQDEERWGAVVCCHQEVAGDPNQS